MKYRKIAGWALISFPFVCIFSIMSVILNWSDVLLILAAIGIPAMVAFCFILGSALLSSDSDECW